MLCAFLRINPPLSLLPRDFTLQGRAKEQPPKNRNNKVAPMPPLEEHGAKPIREVSTDLPFLPE